MPHAVIVTSYPFPGVGATANRIRSLAVGLANVPKWTVTVVGPGPDDPSKEVDLGSFPYRILCRPEKAYARRNLVKRAVREVWQASRLLRAAYRESPDIVVVSIPSVFLLPSTLMKRRLPVVVDIRDLVWEYLSNRRGMKRVAGLFFRRMSSFCLSRASAITVTNSLERDTLAKTGFNNAVIVRNGIEEERYLALSGIARRNSSARREKLEILYVGNIGIAQELDTIVMAVKDIEGVHCTIVGNGADARRLAGLIAEQNVANVTMVDPVPWDRLLDYYETADVLYAQIGNDFTSAVPSKLFEYLATGRAVLFGSAEGSARDLLRAFGNVHFVPSGNVESHKSKILEIMKNRPLQVNWDNIDAVGNKHLRETQAARFAQVVEGIYQGKHAACAAS